MSPRTCNLWLSIGLLYAAAGGCAHWTKAPSEVSSLPGARMSPDSVALEITFVRLPTDATEFDAAFWCEVDEQSLSADLRRRYAANGLRCGLLGSQLPAPLRRLVDAATEGNTSGETLAPLDESGVQQRTLHSRAGKRGEIVASGTQDKMVLLTQDEGRARGKTYSQAQGMFAVKTFPQGDGRVKIELTPELHYGQARTKYVPGQEGAFQLETSREQEVFERLRLEEMLAPGQTLVLASQGDIGLGGQFFTEKVSGGVQRKLLLVRVAQTQLDDLFAPEQVRKPLATAAE
jgi:hypothetical protein